MYIYTSIHIHIHIYICIYICLCESVQVHRLAKFLGIKLLKEYVGYYLYLLSNRFCQTALCKKIASDYLPPTECESCGSVEVPIPPQTSQYIIKFLNADILLAETWENIVASICISLKLRSFHMFTGQLYFFSVNKSIHVFGTFFFIKLSSY